MSGHSIPNGAGSLRGSRAFRIRQRVVSDSAVARGISLDNSECTLLADIRTPSVSDIHSSKASSQVSFGFLKAAVQNKRSRHQSTNSPSAPLTPKPRSTSSGLRDAGGANVEPATHRLTPLPSRSVTPSLRSPTLTDCNPPFFLEKAVPDEDEKKPNIKRFFSTVSSKWFPKKLSGRVFSDGLASRAKLRLPKTFDAVIRTRKVSAPVQPHRDISLPYDFVHKQSVTEEPGTGKLLNLPAGWEPPPASLGDASSSSGSSRAEPRATQAGPSPTGPLNQASQCVRRRTQSHTPLPDHRRQGYPTPDHLRVESRQALESGSPSEDIPPPVPAKDPPFGGRWALAGSQHPRDASTTTAAPARRPSTSHTPGSTNLPPAVNPETQFFSLFDHSQCATTTPSRFDFRPAHPTARSPHPPYGYL